MLWRGAMRLHVLALLVAVGVNAGCSGSPDGGTPDDANGEGGASVVPPGDDAGAPGDAGHGDAGPALDAAGDVHQADAGAPHDAGTGHDAAHDAAPEASACAKHLTVVFSVGTGAGSLASHSGACWDVIDADGAADPSWRKCSTSNYVVKNASAPNWAFDDSNPDAPLAQDQSFLSHCAQGATGIGFEYLAYRGSWRLMFPANHLKAFFAELHASDDDVDDNWPGAYVGNAQLANHTVYPMINIGPRNDASPEAKIQNDGLAICKTVKDGGYFGVYVGTWDQPMPSNDPRILALATALDACTK
jgi:hypothetical protein